MYNTTGVYSEELEKEILNLNVNVSSLQKENSDLKINLEELKSSNNYLINELNDIKYQLLLLDGNNK